MRTVVKSFGIAQSATKVNPNGKPMFDVVAIFTNGTRLPVETYPTHDEAAAAARAKNNDDDTEHSGSASPFADDNSVG